jgi:hypothetical protein
MPAHRYVVGQAIVYTPESAIGPAYAGLYVVARLLPEEGHAPRYLIRSVRDGHQRAVSEVGLMDAPSDAVQRERAA